MSPFKLTINRKRRHIFDSSDSDTDSDDDVLKVKKHCKDRASFTSRLKQLMSWVTDLNVNQYFLRSVQMGTSRPVTLIDDEVEAKEVDNEVVILEEVNPKGKPNPFYDRTRNRQAFINGSRRRSTRLSDSFICATNGFNNLSLSPTKNSRNGINKNCFYEESLGSSVNDRIVNGVSKISKQKVLSPVTNPETDIQILVDTHEKSESDADEIIILSECTHSKSSSAHSRRATRNRSTGDISAISMYSKKKSEDKEKKAFQMPDPSSCVSNSFTAFEVIRLHEKQQYQELLDKYMKNQLYQPVKKTTDQDVEPDSASELLNLEHCNKEVLKQPLDSYLEKYYEPFKTDKKPTDKSRDQQMPDMTVTTDEIFEIDDDISILKVTLPKFKLKYDGKPNFADPKWLSQFQYQIQAQTEERKKIEANQLKILDKMRKERLTKQVIEAIEPHKKQVRGCLEVPEITPEMNEVIDEALRQNLETRVTQTGRHSLCKKDIETLCLSNWLNDEIINYYLELIVQRSKKMENYPRAYAFNTFFYPKLKDQGFASLTKWTKKIDLFSYDLVFVPLHLDIHWALAVMYPKKKKVEYYDSMGSSELCCLKTLSEYLVEELLAKKGQVEISEYITEKVNAPMQMNGSDCGMFTLLYAEFLSRNAYMNFDQANIPYFRRRMIYELLTNTLLSS